MVRADITFAELLEAELNPAISGGGHSGKQMADAPPLMAVDGDVSPRIASNANVKEQKILVKSMSSSEGKNDFGHTMSYGSLPSNHELKGLMKGKTS